MESAPPSEQSRVNNLFCYLPGVLCWVRLRFTEILPDWNINIMVSGQDFIQYKYNWSQLNLSVLKFKCFGGIYLEFLFCVMQLATTVYQKVEEALKL